MAIPMSSSNGFKLAGRPPGPGSCATSAFKIYSD
jgi:hypothetical protein